MRGKLVFNNVKKLTAQFKFIHLLKPLTHHHSNQLNLRPQERKFCATVEIAQRKGQTS